MDCGHIGVDESGKGDYFGPLVIAACYVGPEHLAELEGVRDSKKLTDKAATSLAMKIKQTCPHAVVAIGPAKYNEMYERTPNLNKLLSWGHAQAIENVYKVQPCEVALSDRFGDERTILWHLERKGVAIKLESMVRAESDIAVAAASILARAEFLWRLKRLSDEVGIELPKGATNVIGTGKKLVEKHGANILRSVAKLHFKTTSQVLGTQ
jgi:ribonuclease HIII